MKPVAWVGIGLVTLGAWAGSSAWGAGAPDPPEKPAASFNDAATTSAGAQPVAARMAAELNAECTCTAYTAASLTAQRTQNGWGWGEVLIANELAQALSQKLGISLTKATAMVTQNRQHGMGWGQIAQANGLDLAKAVAGTNRASQGTAGGSSSGGPGVGHNSRSGDGGQSGGGRQGKGGGEGHAGGGGGGGGAGGGGGKGH
jgi:hypothetical protein